MIIRQDDNTFILIEQDHHAHLSAEILSNWQNIFFENDPFYTSVIYAIHHHDCGWKYFDKQPFWNDRHEIPYSFTDFPLLPKLILYTNGVDEVERHDPYAALLCSAHYTSFLKNNSSPEVKEYLNREAKRRKRICSSIPNITNELIKKHLSLLQFADNISLYICLNKPGIKKEDEHHFFKNGIPISNMIDHISNSMVNAYWENKQTIVLQDLPYVRPFQIMLIHKKIEQKEINRHGFLKSYANSPNHSTKLHLKVKH